jgi:pimeloyl-ACP methyl ester carboxylesterase
VVPLCVLLPLFALLSKLGEDFDGAGVRSADADADADADAVVVVLIHGNRFNSCQWVWGRILLHAALGRARRVSFLTVDYFGGPLLCDHSEATGTVEGCSRIALAQILRKLAARGLDPRTARLVLVGHSLGGLVSCYIAEELAAAQGLRVSDVLSWSSPLRGSALLGWALQRPWLARFVDLDEPILQEFDPASTNKTLARLQRRVEASARAGVRYYWGVTGGVDPLVRPDSALLRCFHTRHHSPLLGHYNIKMSWLAWGHCLRHLEQRLALESPTASRAQAAAKNE